MPSRRFACFLKKPRKPFSSSPASKLFSSTTRFAISSPTSPRSFVRTFASAVSEKFAIFFCAPEPYCITSAELVMSIFSAKSSTTFCSSGVSCTSGCSSSFFSGATGFSSSTPSSVRVGMPGAGVSSSGSKVNFTSLMLFVLLIFTVCVTRSKITLSVFCLCRSGQGPAFSCLRRKGPPASKWIPSR